jgi:anti-sigma factor RsiW
MIGTCDQTERAISSYWDRELPPTDVRPMLLHLADCERCRAFLEGLRDTERRIVRQERTFASSALDERIASIGVEAAITGAPRSERPLNHRSSPVDPRGRRRFSFRDSGLSARFLAAGSVSAAVVGFVFGMTQPWSMGAPPDQRPQIVYVTVLPSIAVVGDVSALDHSGEKP